jgi:hypothetical protein
MNTQQYFLISESFANVPSGNMGLLPESEYLKQVPQFLAHHGQSIMENSLSHLAV